MEKIYRSHLWGFTANEKEAYSGENDERQQILQLIIEEKQPEILELPGGGIQVHQEIDAAVAELIEQEALDELEQLVKAQPEAAADQQNPVEPHQDEDDKLSLDNLLEQHRWEGALRRLTRMITPYFTIAGALRLMRSGNTAAAMRYYHDKIESIYSGDTGSAFVNGGVLKEIRDWVNAKRDTPLGEDEATTHMENTCHAIHDYLKLYFPAYRPQIGGKVRGHQVSRVWELGERLGKDDGRCLACHKRVKGFNVTKLQNHLQGSVKRQGIQCPAINNYILSRLERILKEMNEDQ
uniref:Uncharacterized protein n=2 Tax=Oryza sativa subsp. japonica TaxID=39947 RepID=Q2RBK0_ORYSJ|nr:hypothetical protein LOC_Os11g01750 [Oryza sativa Japonica Group]